MARNDYDRRKAMLISELSRKAIISELDDRKLKRIEKQLKNMKAMEIVKYAETHQSLESRWLLLDKLHADWYGFRSRAIETILNDTGLNDIEINVHMLTECWLTEQDERAAVIKNDAIEIPSSFTGKYAMSIDGTGYYPTRKQRMTTARNIINAFNRIGLIGCIDCITIGSLEITFDNDGLHANDADEK